MFCEECGKRINADDKFCEFCGCPVSLNKNVAIEAPAVNVVTPNVQEINSSSPEVIAPNVQQAIPSVNEAATSSVQQAIPSVNEAATSSVQPISLSVQEAIAPNTQGVNLQVPEVQITEPQIQKKRNMKPFIFASLFIITIVAAGFLFFHFRNNNDMILRNSFKHLENVFLGNSGITYNVPQITETLQRGNISIDFTTSDETINSILESLSGLDFDYTIETRNDSAYFDISLNNNDNDVIDLEMLAEGERLYLNSEVLDFPLFIDLGKDIFQEQRLKTEDITYLLNLIFERFIRDMNSSVYTQSSEKINIDGSDVRVTKTTITLNAQELTVLANKILNYLRTDERARNILTTFYEDIDKLVISLPISSENIFVYNIYTKGLLNSEVVGIDFILGSEINERTGGFTQTVSLEYRSGNKDVITLKENEAAIGSVVIEQGNKEITMTMYDNNQNSLATLIVKNPDDNKLDMELIIEGDGQAITLNMNLETEEVTANQEYDIAMVFTVTYSSNMGDFEANVNITNNLTNISGEPARSFDRASSRSFDSLTYDEEQRITEKLIRILEENISGGLLESYFGSEIINNVETNTYCAQAYDCVCLADGCTCLYEDEFNNELPIECTYNDDTYTFRNDDEEVYSIE